MRQRHAVFVEKKFVERHSFGPYSSIPSIHFWFGVWFVTIHSVRKSRFCHDNGELLDAKANTKDIYSIRIVRLSHLFIAILMRA